MAWKEYRAEYWKLQESMDRCTGRRDITEILLKTSLNTIQSINQSIVFSSDNLAIMKAPVHLHAFNLFLHIYSF